MAGEEVRFETPEDVDLSFELAGPGSRAAAAIIDYTLIALLVLALLAVLAAAGVVAFRLRDLFDAQALEELGGLAMAVILAILFAVNLVYFVGAEWAFSGRSLGKRLLGLRVVRDGGYALTFSAAFVRNALRAVDALPGVYAVGLLSVILSTERRRLGDFVAGTLVVRERREAPPVPRFVGESYSRLSERRHALTREHLARLGPESLALLDGYFDRTAGLAPEHAATLRATLAASLAERMGLPPATRDQATEEALLKETYLALRETLEAG